LTGRTLGDFHVLRRLGEGGMGQVYLAEQLSLKRKVALKILRPDLAANPTSLQRFKQEAEAVARATHANIVQVYAIGEFEGQHYMALEYIEGRNLSEYLSKKGTPDLLLALSIMRQAAAALQRASELGIIHRDIKPENILLTRKGEVKVADFGLSRCKAGDQQPLKLTQSGITMGTPLYMSPEQVEGRPLDSRTDIYSFGVTCYHMLAGHPPFRGQTAFEVALKHVNTEPESLAIIRPDLPAELCGLVHKMMAKDPAARYQTAREILKDLARLRESLSGVTMALPLDPEVLEPELGVSQALSSLVVSATAVASARRRRWLPWAVALSLVLAAGGGGVLAGVLRLGWFRPQPTSPTPLDVRAANDPMSFQQREQVLKLDVEHHLDPGNDNDKIDTGLRLCVELGLLYLGQWRLEEAEEFFAKLERLQQVKPYRDFGQLGRAMVLAFQNRPGESNRLFLELLPDRLLAARQNIQLRQMVVKALNYNKENATKTEPFPSNLQSLAKALSLPPSRKPGKDKPPGKEPRRPERALSEE
jgi:serine/threonine-protein kinase